MKYILAEAISQELIINSNGDELLHARVLESSSPKYIAITEIFDKSPISYFLKAGQYFSNFLKIDSPLVFITDWSEATELVGLRLETDGCLVDYPDLCFLAFYTDWDNLLGSSLAELFSHEFSHVWMSWLGYDFKSSLASTFHTSTSITDFFMAFKEGFAECLEIVTQDLIGYSPEEGELWDYGFDGKAWLSARDRQLRYHAVKNNRFIYQTAIPYAEDFDTYANLHIAHITSTAFTPERLKNGSQMLSSEGAVASIFYQIYVHKLFKNAYMEKEFYLPFGVETPDPVINLLVKIFYALSKIDLTKPSLMTDFIRSYGECFPDEKPDMYAVFTKSTHYATVSAEARDVFGEIYRLGRRGNIPKFQEIIKVRNQLVDDLRSKLLDGLLSLYSAVYNEIWITVDEEIPPTPWEPDIKVPYRFNINTATAIDFLSIKGINPDAAEKLVQTRENQHGFTSTDEFDQIKTNVMHNR